MKIKARNFLIILLVSILICNISYAASITASQLETSIKKLFSKNITIVTTVKGDQGEESSTRKITASNINIANSQIQITEATTGKSFYITYKLEGDVCKFSSTLDLSEVDDLEVDPAVLQVMLPMYQATYLELCYLTVADALGVDLSLASTYYYQNSNTQTNSVQNDIFTYSQSTNNNISSLSLDVNLTQLGQLNSSKINSTSACTVTLEDGTTGTTTQQPTTGTTTTPQEQTSTSNTQQQANSTTNTNTVKQNQTTTTKTNTNTNTNTNANKNQTNTQIPKAGLSENLVMGLFILSIVVIFFYVKNKENKDII